VVIGGGPGGVATGIALIKKARSLGRRISVTVVEGKQFVGEQHHNQCSGVLSPPIVNLMERDLGISFPYHLGRSLITGYVLHAAHQKIVLDGETTPSVAVRRVQFDAYMLETALEYGVQVVHARATGLEFHPDRVLIYTEGVPLEAEVVVGAFGLDEGTAALFQRAVGYRHPPALNSIVTKYHPGEEGMQAFGDRIHAFLPANRRIEFGAITPKGNHLTINIAGATVDSDLMASFLNMPEVCVELPCMESTLSPNSEGLQFFKGHFPRGLARNFVGDRYVMVGDAAGLVRAFKGKGVTSAIQTGMRAAEVILKEGISGWAFQDYLQANRDILDDLPYGRGMRLLTITASHFGMMDSVLLAAEKNPRLRQALFDAVSAHRAYREVVRDGITPESIAGILKALSQTLLTPKARENSRL
jgi:flavin-dependent dehydrogenase